MADKGTADKVTTDGQQGSLNHFRAVRDGWLLPHFHQARSWMAETEVDPWTAHTRTLKRWKENAQAPLLGHKSRPIGSSATLLDLKVSLAERMLDDCDLCPHHCHVNRNQGKTGFCGVADRTAVHWEGILHGEEIELMASHEVFLSGCTMRCAFCYSHAHITRPMSGLPMAPTDMAGCADRRHGEGSSNLNLVGGEPTVHIPNILKMLREIAAPLPVIWNSNMYATPQAMALLDGVVDLFLGDVHFGNDACAQQLGLIPDYLPSVKAAFLAAASSQADVIMRHLVMPGHLDCCARPAMEWAAEVMPEVPFHLMFQYVPDFRAARDPVLGRFLSPEEIRRANAMACEIGVNRYKERDAYQEQNVRAGQSSPNAPGTSAEQAVDIIIQGDGRVSFARLLPELLPVAAALDGHDPRILARAAILVRKK